MKFVGVNPPLKYAPTGITKIEKIYSVAGRTATLFPTPIMNGRIYKLPPVPYGGNHCSFAFTTFFTASIKRSSGNSGMSNRRHERAIRAAFWSTRNKLMLPSLQRYAFNPSKHCCP